MLGPDDDKPRIQLVPPDQLGDAIRRGAAEISKHAEPDGVNELQRADPREYNRQLLIAYEHYDHLLQMLGVLRSPELLTSLKDVQGRIGQILDSTEEPPPPSVRILEQLTPLVMRLRGLQESDFCIHGRKGINEAKTSREIASTCAAFGVRLLQKDKQQGVALLRELISLLKRELSATESVLEDLQAAEQVLFSSERIGD